MGKMTAECLLFSLLPLASHDMILIASNLNFGQMSVHPSWSMALLTPERGFMHQSCLTWFVGKITHENILIYYFCSFFMIVGLILKFHFLEQRLTDIYGQWCVTKFFLLSFASNHCLMVNLQRPSQSYEHWSLMNTELLLYKISGYLIALLGLN